MSEYFSRDALIFYAILLLVFVFPLGAFVYYQESNKKTKTSTIEDSTVVSDPDTVPKNPSTYKVTPLMNRAYFSILLDRIDQADTSIKVAMYLFIPPKKGDPDTGPRGLKTISLKQRNEGFRSMSF